MDWMGEAKNFGEEMKKIALVNVGLVINVYFAIVDENTHYYVC